MTTPPPHTSPSLPEDLKYSSAIVTNVLTLSDHIEAAKPRQNIYIIEIKIDIIGYKVIQQDYWNEMMSAGLHETMMGEASFFNQEIVTLCFGFVVKIKTSSMIF